MPDKAPPGDRRLVLAEWMTSPSNAWFARNLANRMWAHFLGRGLVEPIDDVRDTNPPSNPELLDALAKHLVETKYDVKRLIRTIVQARTYQLSSKPNATNEKDTNNYSRSLLRRLDAEVVLDMVSQTTGVPEKFGGGSRRNPRRPIMGQQGDALLPQALLPPAADHRLRMRANPRAERVTGAAPFELAGDPCQAEPRARQHRPMAAREKVGREGD